MAYRSTPQVIPAKRGFGVTFESYMISAYTRISSTLKFLNVLSFHTFHALPPLYSRPFVLQFLKIPITSQENQHDRTTPNSIPNRCVPPVPISSHRCQSNQVEQAG